MPLNDREIARRCGDADFNDPNYQYYNSNPMLHPFVGEKVRVGALSYGLGHFGYDIRIGKGLKKPLPTKVKAYIDPMKADNMDRQCFEDIDLSKDGDRYPLQPGEFVLAGTFEYFRIPSDIVAIVHDKSTLARLGVAVQNTVLEPGWNGYLTMEITNHGTNSIMLSAHMPIAQVMFHKGDIPCQLYDGKYQDQAYAEIAKG